MKSNFDFTVNNGLVSLSVAEQSLVAAGNAQTTPTDVQSLQTNLQLWRDNLSPAPGLTNDGQGTAYLEFQSGELYAISPDGSVQGYFIPGREVATS
jgi:hypothetical protein